MYRVFGTDSTFCFIDLTWFHKFNKVHLQNAIFLLNASRNFFTYIDSSRRFV